MLDKNYHLKLIDFQTAKLMNPKVAAKIPRSKTIVNKENDSLSKLEGVKSRNYSLVGTEEYVSPEII